MGDGNFINKASLWLFVTYPENMVEDWRETAEERLQGLPFAYCVHDKDDAGHNGDRKEHVHWMVDFRGAKGGTTTRNYAKQVMNLLSKEGRICCPGAEACLNAQHAYDYLIHDTETARSQGKHQYERSERVESATFDIDTIVKISDSRKLEMLHELCDFCIEQGITDLAEFYIKYERAFDGIYFQVFKANSALLDRLCRGNYNQKQKKITRLDAPKCCVCDSRAVLGNYRTEMGLLWFCEDHQETAYKIWEEQEEALTV